MPLFRYRAVNASGEVVEGSWEADDQAAVVSRLRNQGMIPIRVEASSRNQTTTGLRPARHKNLSQEQIFIITQDLASLVKAGIPLDRILEILLSIAEAPALRAVLTDVRDQVRGGVGLAAALEAQHGVFSPFYLSMIRAGEAGGSLEVVLQRLAEHLQRSKALRESVRSALVYPAILVFAAGISVTILLTVVVPQFQQLFADMGQSLPLATQIVIAVGDFLRAWGWLLALVITLGVVWQKRRLQLPGPRLRWDAWLLTWPLLGDLLRKLETARLARALATLLGNGVPILQALTISQGIISNHYLARILGGVAEAVKQGRTLHEPLRELGGYPKLAVQMIRVGEESGQLEQMLYQVADTYDLETQATIKRLLTLLEPLLILGLAVLIAGIILSILVAILSLNEVIA